MDSYKQEMRERLEKLRQCAENDTCENTDCAYYMEPYEMLELIEWVDAVFDIGEQMRLKT